MILSFMGLSDRGHVHTHENLFAMCYDKDVKVWDLTTGEIIGSFTARRDTSAMCISLDLVIVADGTYAIDASLVCWNLADGTELFNIQAGTMCTNEILWSPTIGGFCTFSCFDAKVRHYNLAGQQRSYSVTYGDYGDDYSSIGVSAAIPEVILM
jgi:WD40 repeat protein